MEIYQNGVLVGTRTYTVTVDQDNSDTIRAKAAAALIANATFLAIANPTTAQATTQVKALTRECNGLIRMLLGQLDTITDT
jgi:hypothetical protein